MVISLRMFDQSVTSSVFFEIGVFVV